YIRAWAKRVSVQSNARSRVRRKFYARFCSGGVPWQQGHRPFEGEKLATQPLSDADWKEVLVF
ncbi:MAG: hypothetical protein AB4426_05540, partial [Xenococcaceae cyanobacterium]